MARVPAGVSKKRAAKTKTPEEKKVRNEDHSAWRKDVSVIKERVLKKINAVEGKKAGPEDDVKQVKEWLRIEAHIDELEAKVKELEAQVKEKDQLVETIAFEVEKRDEEIDALKAEKQ